ncbi:MAG: 2-oxo acid dehydrogenase subunit E2 [Acidimicrobiales bacterium]
MVDIVMPQLGETVTEGTVTRWTKAVGEAVDEDEVLFEVSTDKVDSEVRSPATGYLTEILVPEGETVDVGVRLAVIGADAPGSEEGATNGVAAPQARDEAQDPDEDPDGNSDPDPGTAEGSAAAPSVAADDPARPSRQQAERGAPGGGAKADPWEKEELDGGSPVNPERPGSGSDGARGSFSPVVRRLLSEHGLDPDQVAGSGAGGRITRADVLAAVDAGRATPAVRSPSDNRAPASTADDRAPASTADDRAPASSAARPRDGSSAARPRDGSSAAATPADAPHYSAPSASRATAQGASLVRSPPAGVPAVQPGTRDEVVPFSNIRRRTAEHMVRSQATSAHTLVAMEVDFEAVEAARRANKDRFLAEEGVKLTYLPFVARALADAISAFPHLNASVGDDCLIVHRDLHLGIAVDLGEEGLIVPVIHEAGDKRLRAIAREAAELAVRARSRKLTADDISGGTFTITNPGPFGTFITAPIINQPQVAILSTDGVRRRPVVVTMPDGSEGIAIHSSGVLALSFDHRALDGAYSSRFLDKMREILQGRDWALEL